MRVRVTRLQPQAQPPDIDKCTDRLIVVGGTTAEHPPLTDLPQLSSNREDLLENCDC